MLADQINEDSGFVYPDGTRQMDVFAPLRARLKDTAIYVLDRDAIAMATNVAMGKPSSMLAALPWVRLPFKRTWIEFANNDVHDAMADLGSPNLPPPNMVVHIVRSGFLMTEENGVITMDYVHTDRTSEGQLLTDMAPVSLRFDLSPARPEVVPELNAAGAVHPDSTSRVREHLRLIYRDPKEADAEAEMRARFSWEPHPDMAAIARLMVSRLGAERISQIQENQGNEAWRLFCTAILPGLILLNCKNAVTGVPVDPGERASRRRVERGRPPFRAHTLVKIRLGAAVSRNMGSSEEVRRAIRASLVRGHFKLRMTAEKTMQLLWWSPHARKGYGTPEHRTTVLTH